MQIEEIIKALQSDDLVKQDFAFKEITAFTANLAAEAVKALYRSPSPTVVAENIFRVAHAFRTPFEKLFYETPSKELKVISAALLGLIDIQLIQNREQAK